MIAEKHGMSGSAEHRAWKNMKMRCSNPNTGYEHCYLDRGITVCTAWRDSFLAFFEDMGPRPSPLHTLDRIDNDGDYEPGNCRWATRREQARNRTTNRLLTFGGLTRPLAEWAERLGTSEGALHKRLARGWPVEAALTTPARAKSERRRHPSPG